LSAAVMGFMEPAATRSIETRSSAAE
jgi:hypothetical protein